MHLVILLVGIGGGGLVVVGDTGIHMFILISGGNVNDARPSNRKSKTFLWVPHSCASILIGNYPSHSRDLSEMRSKNAYYY